MLQHASPGARSFPDAKKELSYLHIYSFYQLKVLLPKSLWTILSSATLARDMKKHISKELKKQKQAPYIFVPTTTRMHFELAIKSKYLR